MENAAISPLQYPQLVKRPKKRYSLARVSLTRISGIQDLPQTSKNPKLSALFGQLASLQHGSSRRSSRGLMFNTQDLFKDIPDVSFNSTSSSEKENSRLKIQEIEDDEPNPIVEEPDDDKDDDIDMAFDEPEIARDCETENYTEPFNVRGKKSLSTILERDYTEDEESNDEQDDVEEEKMDDDDDSEEDEDFEAPNEDIESGSESEEDEEMDEEEQNKDIFVPEKSVMKEVSFADPLIESDQEESDEEESDQPNSDQEESEEESAEEIVPTPAKKVPAVVREDPTPVVEDPTPVKKDPTPARKIPTLARKDPTPAKKVRTPAKKVTTPARKDPTPAKGDPAPVEEDPTPAEKVPTPARKVPKPTKKNPTPAKKDPTPAKKDPTPAKKDPTPAKKNPTPAKNDPTPIKKASVRESPRKKVQETITEEPAQIVDPEPLPVEELSQFLEDTMSTAPPTPEPSSSKAESNKKKKVVEKTPKTVVGVIEEESTSPVIIAKKRKGRNVQKELDSEGETDKSMSPRMEAIDEEEEEEKQAAQRSPRKKTKVDGVPINMTVLEDGTRRSRRNRMQPLDYWRGQRPVYRRDSTGLGTFKLVDVNQGSRPWTPKVACKSKSTGMKRNCQPPTQVIRERMDVFNLSIHEAGMEKIRARNEKTKKKLNSDEVLICGLDDLKWKPSKMSQGVDMAIAHKDEDGAHGYIRFASMSMKEKQQTSEYSTSFTVVHGMISVQINQETPAILQTGSFLRVKPHTWYSMKNLRNDQAFVQFYVIKS